MFQESLSFCLMKRRKPRSGLNYIPTNRRLDGEPVSFGKPTLSSALSASRPVRPIRPVATNFIIY